MDTIVLYCFYSTFSSIGVGKILAFFFICNLFKRGFCWATAFKNFLRCWRQRWKIVPKTTTYTGMICVKTQEPSISSLGPLNNNLHAKDVRRGDPLYVERCRGRVEQIWKGAETGWSRDRVAQIRKGAETVWSRDRALLQGLLKMKLTSGKVQF